MEMRNSLCKSYFESCCFRQMCETMEMKEHFISENFIFISSQAYYSTAVNTLIKNRFSLRYFKRN